jgi:ribose transport system ATP-binding protein
VSGLPATARLSMRGVVVVYGDTRALDGADLVVRPGERHALLGENGAGKSSLLKALLGAAPMRSGAIEVDGVAFAPRGPSDADSRGIAVAHQELSTIPHLSVADAIALGSHAVSRFVVDRRARDAFAEAALRLVFRADISLRAQVRSLPVADRQMVEHARAFARATSVLVLDEPTSSLTADDAERLYAAVDAAASRGLAVVFVSHDLAEVRRVADAATVLRDGRTAFAGRLKDCKDEDLVRHMAGRDVEVVTSRRAGGLGDVVLRVEGLCAPPAVREATFELRRGEILGIAGLAGAGRTELLETAFGLRTKASGRVEFALRGGAGTPCALWRGGVGMVAEDRKLSGLSLSQCVADNVALPSVARLARFGILASGAAVAAANSPCAQLRVKLRSLLQPVRELSGGNQQKVAFARLLAAGSDLLFLDEPTRGIDVGSRAEIHAWMRARCDDGAAIVVVSSQMPELLAVCDRIAVMRQGCLQPARPVETWTHESLVAAALHQGRGGEEVA